MLLEFLQKSWNNQTFFEALESPSFHLILENSWNVVNRAFMKLNRLTKGFAIIQLERKATRWLETLVYWWNVWYFKPQLILYLCLTTSPRQATCHAMVLCKVLKKLLSGWWWNSKNKVLQYTLYIPVNFSLLYGTHSCSWYERRRFHLITVGGLIISLCFYWASGC